MGSDSDLPTMKALWPAPLRGWLCLRLKHSKQAWISGRSLRFQMKGSIRCLKQFGRPPDQHFPGKLQVVKPQDPPTPRRLKPRLSPPGRCSGPRRLRHPIRASQWPSAEDGFGLVICDFGAVEAVKGGLRGPFGKSPSLTP